jgi:hypothetical protein
LGEFVGGEHPGGFDDNHKRNPYRLAASLRFSQLCTSDGNLLGVILGQMSDEDVSVPRLREIGNCKAMSIRKPKLFLQCPEREQGSQ